MGAPPSAAAPCSPLAAARPNPHAHPHCLSILAVYAGTKAFVDALSRSLDAEYGPLGVRVQNQSPMFVATKMSKIRWVGGAGWEGGEGASSGWGWQPPAGAHGVLPCCLVRRWSVPVHQRCPQCPACPGSLRSLTDRSRPAPCLQARAAGRAHPRRLGGSGCQADWARDELHALLVPRPAGAALTACRPPWRLAGMPCSAAAADGTGAHEHACLLWLVHASLWLGSPLPTPLPLLPHAASRDPAGPRVAHQPPGHAHAPGLPLPLLPPPGARRLPALLPMTGGGWPHAMSQMVCTGVVVW